jgi:hypothetical protein
MSSKARGAVAVQPPSAPVKQVCRGGISRHVGARSLAAFARYG